MRVIKRVIIRKTLKTNPKKAQLQAGFIVYFLCGFYCLFLVWVLLFISCLGFIVYFLCGFYCLFLVWVLLFISCLGFIVYFLSGFYCLFLVWVFSFFVIFSQPHFKHTNINVQISRVRPRKKNLD